MIKDGQCKNVILGGPDIKVGVYRTSLSPSPCAKGRVGKFGINWQNFARATADCHPQRSRPGLSMNHDAGRLIRNLDYDIMVQACRWRQNKHVQGGGVNINMNAQGEGCGITTASSPKWDPGRKILVIKNVKQMAKI